VKLQYRLVFPLLAVALAVTVAVTAGMALLVRETVAVTFRQSSAQLGRITGNALKDRAAGLRDIATVFASLRGDVHKRDGMWKHPPLDAAVVMDGRNRRIMSSLGSSLDTADLSRIAPDIAVPIVRMGDGLAIAGVALSGDAREIVVVAKRLDARFASELADLLQAGVEISLAGHVVASAVDGPFDPGARYRVTSEFASPGGAVISVAMLMPAAELVAARRKALLTAVGGGFVLLIAAFVFYAYAVSRIIRPIRDLIAGARRVAAGDLDSGMDSRAPAELGELMREFNRMARSLKETQEKLVHSAKLSSVGILVAGISHELNNPLSGLLGHAEHLATKFPVSDPIREKLDTIVREAGRMKRTLVDLRSFTRPSVRDRRPVDINLAIGEILALVRHDAEKTGVAFSANLAPGAGIACAGLPAPGAGAAGQAPALPAPGGVRVMGSPDEIRQVLLNLVINSLDAMPKGGTIRISTSLDATGGRELARIAVEDSGAGMPPEVKEKVTEPFFTTKPGRIGLGLAICREIIMQHGGTLKIDSEPGKGTVVTVELPAEDDK